MSLDIEKLHFDEREVGKTIKASKKYYLWQFVLNNKFHKVELFHSKISGKKKLCLDAQKLVEDKGYQTTFEYSFKIDRNYFNVVQIKMDKFSMRIDNRPYKTLMEEERAGILNKNKNKNKTEIKQSSSKDNNNFWNNPKRVDTQAIANDDFFKEDDGDFDFSGGKSNKTFGFQQENTQKRQEQAGQNIVSFDDINEIKNAQNMRNKTKRDNEMFMNNQNILNSIDVFGDSGANDLPNNNTNVNTNMNTMPNNAWNSNTNTNNDLFDIFSNMPGSGNNGNVNPNNVMGNNNMNSNNMGMNNNFVPNNNMNSMNTNQMAFNQFTNVNNTEMMNQGNLGGPMQNNFDFNDNAIIPQTNSIPSGGNNNWDFNMPTVNNQGNNQNFNQGKPNDFNYLNVMNNQSSIPNTNQSQVIFNSNVNGNNFMGQPQIQQSVNLGNYPSMNYAQNQHQQTQQFDQYPTIDNSAMQRQGNNSTNQWQNQIMNSGLVDMDNLLGMGKGNNMNNNNYNYGGNTNNTPFDF